MPISPDVLALLWLLPSLFLHTGIHEGSHALAAELTGGTVTRLSFLPGPCGGRLEFGCVDSRGGSDAAIAIAPLVAEGAWIIGACLLSRRPLSPHLRAVLRAELLAALVDASVWILGAFSQQPTTDAAHFRTAVGLSQPGLTLAATAVWGAIPAAVGLAFQF